MKNGGVRRGGGEEEFKWKGEEEEAGDEGLGGRGGLRGRSKRGGGNVR